MITERSGDFPQISDLKCLLRVITIRNISYQYYLEQPTQKWETVLNRNFDGDPHLKNAPDKTLTHLLIRK